MNINKWTVALAAAGVVSLASVANAQEAKETVKTLAASTTLSGYVSTSVNWTPGHTAGVQGYFANTAKSDRIALDVISLTVASKAGEGEWAAGYKAQLWAGPDAQELNTSSVNGDVAIKNAYISLRAPLGTGVDLKLGVFDTIIGYESTDRNVNPFYSHSWGFSIEPTQHTGLLASYRVSDAISLSAGVANTTDALINGQGANTSRKTYMVATTLTAPDSFGFLKGTSVTAGLVSGRSNGGGASTQTDSLYVGGTIPLPVKDLSLGVAWDEEIKDNAADRSVLAAYLSYKVSDKLTTNLRYEYADAGAGTIGNLTASHELHSISLGLDYKLWANVTSRVEYRLDISDDGNAAANLINSRKNNSAVIANVIYNF